MNESPNCSGQYAIPLEPYPQIAGVETTVGTVGVAGVMNEL